MDNLTPDQLAFWNSYIESLPGDSVPLYPDIVVEPAGNFSITDELIALYLSGKKTAGSSLKEDFLTCGDPLPELGSFWMVLSGDKTPALILQTYRIEEYKFSEVPEKVAIAEGEGDLSLEYWRKTHINFFSPYLEKWGIKNIDDATSIVEYFEIVWK